MHSQTPRLSVNDPRGLEIRTVDYWRAVEGQRTESRISRTALDGAGRVLEQWDPRLWTLQISDPRAPANLRLVHSLDATVLSAVSVDDGTRIRLPGLAGQELGLWDSRGTRRDNQYDPMLRCTAVFEQGESLERCCVERITFAHPGMGDQARNQYGQVIRHDHPAGSVLFDGYAISGECIADTRHFTLDPTTPDWPEPITDRQKLLEPGAGATSTWRYGPLGNVLEQTDARENRHSFALTLDGRLHERRLQLKGQPAAQPVITDIRYNREGKIEAGTAGNGVRTTLIYQAEDGRLRERRAEDAAGRTLQRLTYAYDRMGNILQIADHALPVRYFAGQRIDPISEFFYDSLYQLIEATGWEAGSPNQGPTSIRRAASAGIANYRQQFRYDASGNLLTLTHVGAQNHGREVQAARYSNRCLPWRNGIPPSEEEIHAAHDDNGNLLLLDQGRSLIWSLRNQLQAISPVTRTGAVSDQEHYLYSGLGQRVRKIRKWLTNARTLSAEVRYLPALEVRSHSGTGELLDVVVIETELHNVRVLHWNSPPPLTNDQYRFSCRDHLGSLDLELAADARIISREHYYPFGETAWGDGDAVEVHYKVVRYSGKERDASGLYDFGYRLFIPWLQRWLNPDSAGAIDGHNRYRAMRNSPMVYRDPDGRVPEVTGGDRVYHDLADQGLVHPIQAAGMQPVRRYFEHDPNPDVQAYRREIPVALAELGARSDSPLNTHQAHVIAAARTGTASPSGAVLYHSGELLSSVMTQVVGEAVTSRVMGPMSVAFNSPVEDPQILASRRGAVASTFRVGGKILMHSAHPALQVAGAAGVAMGNAMEASEAQTRIQYRMLTSPASVAKPVVEHAPEANLTALAQSFSQPPQTLFDEQPATPSVWAQQLFSAGFTSPPSIVQSGAQPVEPAAIYRSRRGSHHA